MPFASRPFRQADTDGELGGVVGAAAGDLLVGRQRVQLGLAPFLERGLRIACVLRGAGDAVGPEPQDERAGGLEAGVAVDGREHRLHRIPQERGLAAPRPTASRSGLAAAPRRARRRGATSAQASLRTSALKRGGDAALPCVLVLGEHGFRDDEAEDAVAEELEALVALPARAGGGAVHEGAAQEGFVGEAVAEPILEGAEALRAHTIFS